MDFGYLEGFAAGDQTVVREVLKLFLESAEVWRDQLVASNSGWPDLVHTIKGSSRGIGATALASASEQAEAGGVTGLPAVKAALAAAVDDINAYLARG